MNRISFFAAMLTLAITPIVCWHPTSALAAGPSLGGFTITLPTTMRLENNVRLSPGRYYIEGDSRSEGLFRVREVCQFRFFTLGELSIEEFFQKRSESEEMQEIATASVFCQDYDFAPPTRNHRIESLEITEGGKVAILKLESASHHSDKLRTFIALLPLFIDDAAPASEAGE